jgi:hypothetical protein
MDLSSADGVIIGELAEIKRQADQAFEAGRLRESLCLLEDCLERAKNLSVSEQVPIFLKVKFAPSLYNLGQALCAQGDFASGVRSLEHVVEIERSFGDPSAQASILSDIATIYFEQGYYEKAITLYMDEVLPLRIQMNDRLGEARAHRNIGLAYARLQRAPEAYAEIKMSIEKAMSCGATQQARLGLETTIALSKGGLDIPNDIRRRFQELAEYAKFWDLETHFREEGNYQDETDEKVRFRRIRVFVSYSHSDRQIVSSICEWLDSPVFDVFVDQNRLHPGWKWESLLMGALENADVLLLFVGSDTMSRPYVRKEIETYLGSKRPAGEHRIVPILLPGCTDLPTELSSYQWYDLRENIGSESVRLLGRTIWNAVHHPEPELARESRGPSIDTSRSSSDVVDIEKKWKSGEVAIGPTGLVQMVNLGILRHGIACRHRELDMATFAPRSCEALAKVLCIGCGKGTCSDPVHVYDWFCTVIPPQGMFERGVKLFYWCPNCRAPICTHCLGIEDDYPCPPDQVLSYRFRCPACQKIVQVVPVLEVDFKGVAETLLRWSRTGGPSGET